MNQDTEGAEVAENPPASAESEAPAGAVADKPRTTARRKAAAAAKEGTAATAEVAPEPATEDLAQAAESPAMAEGDATTAEVSPAAAQAAVAAPAGPQAAPTPAPAGRPERKRGGRYTPRRKVCVFCVDRVEEIDYKDAAKLRRFLSDRGKIEPRRKTGTCAKHQRRLTIALKRARHLALLPFTSEHMRQSGAAIPRS